MKTFDVKVGNIVNEVTEGIIIQQVNAQGVMGSGVAKHIRDKWPIVWQKYSKEIPKGGNGSYVNDFVISSMHMGKMIPVQVDTNLWVCNVVGQQFFGREPEKQIGGRYTSYDALANGLAMVYHFAMENFVLEDNGWVHRPMIHFPLIGCGLGGGDWNIVSRIIETQLPSFKKTLWVLKESDKPEEFTA